MQFKIDENLRTPDAPHCVRVIARTGAARASAFSGRAVVGRPPEMVREIL